MIYIGIAIGAALYAILLPAVQAVREMVKLKSERLQAAADAAEAASATAARALELAEQLTESIAQTRLTMERVCVAANLSSEVLR